MKKEKVFNFLNLFNKKDTQVKQEEKKFSKIVNSEFETTDGYDVYFNNHIVGTFKVLGNDNKIYYIVAKTDDYAGLNITFRQEDFIRIKEIMSFGYIHINNNQLIYDFSRIEMLNSFYKGYGIPYLMMEAMFEVLNYYAEKYGVVFTTVTGTVGVGGGDIPERSIPLYKSFNGYNFNGKKIVMKEETCNVIDREILYKIV